MPDPFERICSSEWHWKADTSYDEIHNGIGAAIHELGSDNDIFMVVTAKVTFVDPFIDASPKGFSFVGVEYYFVGHGNLMPGSAQFMFVLQT